MKADVHIHSTCSDGTLSPKEILCLAKKKKLFGLSITDHDTIDAYQPDFFSLAQKLKLQILSGIEISAKFKEENIHILGYCFDLTHKGFRFFIEQIQKNREQRNHKILENLSLLGINIDPKLLFTKSIIGRPHIAQMLVEKKVVRNLQEAFDLYLKEGAKAYHSGIVPTPQQVIENIHEANGKAIIAHPHVVKSSILQNLYDLPFDGIECYYARFSSDREKPFIKIAKKKNWLITGGSDFHGSIKPRNALGSSWIDEKEFNLLRT